MIWQLDHSCCSIAIPFPEKNLEEEGEEIEEVNLINPTITHDEEKWISEYGPSDGVLAGSSEDSEIFPQQGSELIDSRSDFQNANEHKPDELNDADQQSKS
jgi:hypothetical protein